MNGTLIMANDCRKTCRRERVQHRSDKDRLLDGLTSFSLGNDDAALQAFHRVGKESKESSFAALCMSKILIKRRKYQEAIDLLHELIERSPDSAQAYYLLGLAYTGMHESFEAIRWFRKVLEQNPGDPRAQSELDRLLEVQEP